MYFTPTIFIAQLLAAMQVLMTLHMPLSTTMALPVTSKPIESTVENLAWKAWLELSPEEKQQVKSRKVTPKSIFTIPLHVKCPDGNKKVDSKCVPVALTTDEVLVELGSLGLLISNSQTSDQYDYDDVGEDIGSPLPMLYDGDMLQEEAEESVRGTKVELKPPLKDEPLKFNIFKNKFNIFHEEPFEDYSSISYEGMQSSEKEQNVTINEGHPKNTTLNATAINDLLSEASNIPQLNFDIYIKKDNNSSNYTKADEDDTLTTLLNEEDFKFDVISVPTTSFNKQKSSNTLPVMQNHNSNIIGTATTPTSENKLKPQENYLQMLLQTESFLPLTHQATANTLKDQESFSLSTVADQQPNESQSEILELNIEDEMTTLPSIMEPELKEIKKKVECIRSVTVNPLIANDNDSINGAVNDGSDQVNETTLENETNDDEPLETTTPIQLDDTTIIETPSSLFTTVATQQKLKEMIMQRQQERKNFEELQSMHTGHKDQQHILKKSKVEPVEVLSTTITTPAATETTETTTTKAVDELLTSTTAAETETVTPLLTVHNENDNNNDRFYYQHFAKQDLKPQASSVVTTTTKATDIKTIPLTSEIDLAEEWRLINEIVKGTTPATTFKTIKAMQAKSTKPTSTTTIKTAEKPLSKTFTTDETQSITSPAALSESFSVATKPTPPTFQIWSKIMPHLTTTSTTALPTPQSSLEESIKSSTLSATFITPDISNDISNAATATSLASTRNERNSKIIRFNNINSNTEKITEKTITNQKRSSTTSATTTSGSSSSSSTENIESSTESNTYEPYWWLPISWRLDKPTSSEKPSEEHEAESDEQSLLLRLWSVYQPPKAS